MIDGKKQMHDVINRHQHQRILPTATSDPISECLDIWTVNVEPDTTNFSEECKNEIKLNKSNFNLAADGVAKLFYIYS